MSRRDKTRFERWFSLSRHKRRSGAIVLSEKISSDFSQQKQITIDGDEIQYTHGSSNNLEEHFVALRDEFIDQSELCYTHAKIIAYKLSSENSFYSKCKILGSSQGINQEILVAMPVLRLGLAVVIWCDLLSFNQSGYDGFCTVA